MGANKKGMTFNKIDSPKKNEALLYFLVNKNSRKIAIPVIIQFQSEDFQCIQ